MTRPALHSQAMVTTVHLKKTMVRWSFHGNDHRTIAWLL